MQSKGYLEITICVLYADIFLSFPPVVCSLILNYTNFDYSVKSAKHL